jgi:predicted RND superfamily exporter protein
MSFVWGVIVGALVTVVFLPMLKILFNKLKDKVEGL